MVIYLIRVVVLFALVGVALLFTRAKSSTVVLVGSTMAFCLGLLIPSAFMFLFARNLFAVVPLAFMGGLGYLGFYLNNPFYSILLIAFLSTMIFVLGIDSLHKLFKYKPEGSDATILKFYVGGAERFWIGLMIVITIVDSFLFPYLINLLLDQVQNINFPSF
jgi:hypothetical protein